MGNVADALIGAICIPRCDFLRHRTQLFPRAGRLIWIKPRIAKNLAVVHKHPVIDTCRYGKDLPLIHSFFPSCLIVVGFLDGFGAGFFGKKAIEGHKRSTTSPIANRKAVLMNNIWGSTADNAGHQLLGIHFPSTDGQV